MNIYPSLMVVPQEKLEKEIQLLAPHCAGFHIDSMDGFFVPRTFWYDAHEVNAIVKHAQRVWIHLMVQKPDLFYEQLKLPADSLVSFHLESDINIFSFSQAIREKKHRASLAIHPKTPINDALPFLSVVDQVLVMSVNPGSSGQLFLESTYDKISALVAYRQKYGMHFSIGADGGINETNITLLSNQGVNDCAIASGIFDHQNPIAAVQELQRIC